MGGFAMRLEFEGLGLGSAHLSSALISYFSSSHLLPSSPPPCPMPQAPRPIPSDSPGTGSLKPRFLFHFEKPGSNEPHRLQKWEAG